MGDLYGALNSFVAEILATEEYQAYIRELDKVKAYPELKAQIDDYRKQNYLLESGTDIDFNKLDMFEREYEVFRENPLVSDFLDAELAFIRLMQGLNANITSKLHFE